jgi:hypothetical protein
MNRSSLLTIVAVTSAVAAGLLTAVLPASAETIDHVTLAGRAVLPAATLAPGPPAGTLLPPGVVNGITFPLPSQPVQGFSSVIDGRHPGEYLAMPDNGFGAKTNSGDFLIRAYYIRPEFKTAQGGTGSVAIGPATRSQRRAVGRRRVRPLDPAFLRRRGPARPAVPDPWGALT